MYCQLNNLQAICANQPCSLALSSFYIELSWYWTIACC